MDVYTYKNKTPFTCDWPILPHSPWTMQNFSISKHTYRHLGFTGNQRKILKGTDALVLADTQLYFKKHYKLVFTTSVNI